MEQTKGQYDLSFNQVPIREAIENESDPEIKKLLTHVPEIKAFAVETLQLKDSDQYRGYYATKKDGITFVVTAAYKTKLKAYTWWFPFIGTVPYKGYFKEKDAIELEQELLEEGLDTWRFNAPAYSTLGYFSDPVTTPMLRNGLFSLTKTIIHELVHGTVYIKGASDFNEQLAKFVEYKGAIQYLQSKHLITSEGLQALNRIMCKKIDFARLIDRYLKRVDQLYQKEMEKVAILKEREVLFQNLTDDILELYPENKREDWIFNNARLLQYRRYKEVSPIFEKIWNQSQQNWQVFWENIRLYIEKKGEGIS